MLTKTAGTTNWSEAHERAGIDDTHASARSGKISVSARKADICAAWDAPTALRGPAAAELRGAKLRPPAHPGHQLGHGSCACTASSQLWFTLVITVLKTLNRFQNMRHHAVASTTAELVAFLRDHASIHESILDVTMRALEEKEVFTVLDLMMRLIA